MSMARNVCGFDSLEIDLKSIPVDWQHGARTYAWSRVPADDTAIEAAQARWWRNVSRDDGTVPYEDLPALAEDCRGCGITLSIRPRPDDEIDWNP